MKKTLRISITGPESTGKSWLAEQLAIHYKTLWVKEFARDYLNTINRDYTYDDILYIAKNQLHQENKFAILANSLLFCDTDLLVPKIWCEVKYGKYHDWIQQQLEEHHYDLYLLCDIDLPWEYDPLREHPQERQMLLDLYQNELITRALPYKMVQGIGGARLQKAIQFVEALRNLPVHQ